MRTKLLIVLLALAALAGVYFAVGGDPLGLFSRIDREGDRAGGAGLDADADGRAGGDAAQAAPRRGPRLFGSERAMRAGKGALRGRVIDVRTNRGLPSATLVVTGTGYAKETVAVRGESGSDGAFQLLDVPAGDGLALRIEAPGPLSRGVTGIEVPAGGLTDLGDLYLGQPGIVDGVVLDPAGEGVVGAEVELHRGIASLRDFMQSGGFIDFLTNIDRQPEPTAAQQSKARGAFRFESVSPGPLTLLVRAPGYRQAVVPVTLTADRAQETVTVRLSLGAMISGKVVDAEGHGVRGAHVAAFSAEGGMPTPLARTFGDCADDGSFRLTTLSGEGKQLLIAGAAGWPNAFSEARSGSNDVRIVLVRGATLELRFLSDDDSQPLADAQVLAAIGETRQMGGGAPGGLVGGLTDRAGVVTLEVRPGELQFLVLSCPDAPTTMWAGGQKMPGQMKGPDSTTLAPGTNRMTFRVPRGALVKGRVLDGGDKPLAGAEVVSLGFLGKGSSTVSAEDGTFQLYVQRDLSMGLVAQLPGWVQDKVERPPRPAGDAGASIEMTLRLRPATSVTGKVVTADGKPVGGAQVAVRREREGGGFDFESMLAAQPSGLTLSDGTYLVSGVPAGVKVRVLAQRTGYVDSGSPPFEVGADGATTAPAVVLRTGAHVLVRVTDAEGRSLKAARVRTEVSRSDGLQGGFEELMERQAGVHDHRTGADGSVEIRELPPGELTLRVAAEGQAPAVAKAKIGDDAEELPAITVRLEPALVLEGRVLDTEGRPIRGARVHARNRPQPAPAPVPANTDPGAVMSDAMNEWDPSRFATTDAQGAFRLPDLANQGYRLHVTAEEHKAAQLDAGPEKKAVEVRLAPLDPAQQKRIEALQEELQGLYAQLQGLEGPEQQKLLLRINALQEELKTLQGGD